jgi:protein-S-isoprenylcysteine O-methyltransferase Ste14
MISRLLVAGQLGLIAGLIATSGWPSAGAQAWLVTGGVLGLWALASMPLHQMRIVPEVHPRGHLVRRGPYRWIRHPMYAAVLLAAGGLVATDPAPFRIAMGLALAVLLVVKLVREERLLRAAYPDYAAYQAATRRLVPWVW